jgi:serine/threonine protein kinase
MLQVGTVSEPKTIADFLQLARQAGVMEESQLQPYLPKLRAEGLAAEPAPFADELVANGQLTYFQAEQLLQGKHRGFFIGKYKILERLGSGGMAQVYLCAHKTLGQRVAIKVLPSSLQDPSLLKRFLREARASAVLQHPNIVRAHDLDEEDRVHFLVMEYIEGSLLQDIVTKHGPLDIPRSAHYMRQVAIGLQYAHDAGVVHRDIKPGNLIVDTAGTVKILDMGLARLYQEVEVLTTGVLGTPDYLAPEQALDSHNVDGRADVYSMGCTMYFMLSGGPPFAQGSVAMKLLAHQNRQPLPLRGLRPEVPVELAAVVARMMGKSPLARYQSAAETAQALAPWTSGPPLPPPALILPRLSLAARGGRTGTNLSVRPQVTPVPQSRPSAPAATPIPPKSRKKPGSWM